MLPRLGTPVFRGEDVSSWRKQVGVVSTGALLASSSAVAGVGSRALTPARELRGGQGGLAPPPALPRVSGFSARSRFPPQGSPFLRLAQLAFSMHYLFLSLISFAPPVLPPDRSGHPLQGSELICHSSFLLRALGKFGKVDEMLCPPSPP